MADVIGSSPVVIQGGSKVKHLRHIASESGVSLRDMVFFDNERNNIQEVEKVGPTCVYCPRGLTEQVYREGISVHVANRAGSSPAVEGGGRRGGTGRRKDADDETAASRSRANRKKDRGKGGRRR